MEGGATRRWRCRGLAQFCANRLVRRETKAPGADFFSRPERACGQLRHTPAFAATQVVETMRVDAPAKKALVFRIGLQRTRRRHGSRAARAVARSAALRRRPVAPPEKKSRTGVDSEKNRD
ncbi:hypothetical protein [Pseudoxanthomonas suwonensis]|uniref:hypothetical protein n=1 Tax=Pseudoxanthomonas suwonensis TaxID=314722 RepID=UPI001185CED9|nr:hypothetical protein [Pseudoxanthomonas suwonensis]